MMDQLADTSLSAEPGAPACGVLTALSGLPRLMTLAFEGIDLAPRAQALIERARLDPADANALMDLSTILLLQGINDLGLATQSQALQISRVYELPAACTPSVTLLVIMTCGDLMTNAPLAFLVEDSAITLRMLYVLPGESLPAELPTHDAVMVAVSESNQTRDLLLQLDRDLGSSQRPVLNRPGRILNTSRALAWQRLKGLPGIAMPATERVSRAALLALTAGEKPLQALLPDGVFPLIIRPVDSHAGNDLDKLDSMQQLPVYLDATPGEDFYISRFVDYSDADGLFRKYRVVLIDGLPYAAHMGVSERWMIHYLNAGMTASAAKRAEEEVFMRDFETGFARRHALALQAVSERFGLEYLVVDCAQGPDGDLLVFEVDPGAVVHSMDPVSLFPYKPQAMEKVYTAYRSMVKGALRRLRH
jgi:glutathione synthase/RimK-type ligase-like ATP-grasp enzyme